MCFLFFLKFSLPCLDYNHSFATNLFILTHTHLGAKCLNGHCKKHKVLPNMLGPLSSANKLVHLESVEANVTVVFQQDKGACCKLVIPRYE